MMTIDIGWWAVPLLLTVASFIIAVVKMPKEDPPGSLPNVTGALVCAAYLVMAMTASLSSWLAWALMA